MSRTTSTLFLRKRNCQSNFLFESPTEAEILWLQWGQLNPDEKVQRLVDTYQAMAADAAKRLGPRYGRPKWTSYHRLLEPGKTSTSRNRYRRYQRLFRRLRDFLDAQQIFYGHYLDCQFVARERLAAVRHRRPAYGAASPFPLPQHLVTPEAQNWFFKARQGEPRKGYLLDEYSSDAAKAAVIAEKTREAIAYSDEQVRYILRQNPSRFPDESAVFKDSWFLFHVLSPDYVRQSATFVELIQSGYYETLGPGVTQALIDYFWKPED